MTAFASPSFNQLTFAWAEPVDSSTNDGMSRRSSVVPLSVAAPTDSADTKSNDSKSSFALEANKRSGVNFKDASSSKAPVRPSTKPSVRTSPVAKDRSSVESRSALGTVSMGNASTVTASTATLARPSVTTERMTNAQQSPTAVAMRRGKPEHISDLLLVVLDKYGIDPNEFLDGLQ